MKVGRMVILLLGATCVYCLPVTVTAATCSSAPLPCPKGQVNYYAPTGSSICENGGFYCKTTTTTQTPTTPKSTNTPAITTKTPARPASSTLSLGSRGTAVLSLQKTLITLGLLAPENATGYFGPLTKAAVEAFQRNNSIVSSGTPSTTGYGAVGPKTRALLAVAKPGTSTPQAPLTTTQSPTPNKPNLVLGGGGGGGGTTTVSPVITYSWQTGGWSACQNSTQSRTVQCTSSTNTTAADSLCASSKPAATQSCTVAVTSTCTPLPQETQTLACPAGQTGSITQTRNSSCAAGATSPTWSAWSTTSNTCATPIPVTPVVLTKYPNFTNICERRVIDYQNGTNVLSPAPADCAWPNNPFLFSVTHESALNTHWRLAPDGTKIYDSNFVGDSAVYMHDYRDSDLGVIFRHDFTPLAGASGANFLGMALDTVNFTGTNVTGRDFRDGHLFMGLNDLSIPVPSLSKNIYVNLTFRIRGNDLVPYQGTASSHRLILGAKLTWPETGRTNTAHYFEFNLFKTPDFHVAQTQYSCPSDGLMYDYCFYDSSAAGLYAEGKYIPISNVSGYQSLSNITTDTWYTVRIPLSALARDSGWFSPPQSWNSAILDGLYLGIESRGASRLWVEIKDYTVTEE